MKHHTDLIVCLVGRNILFQLIPLQALREGDRYFFTHADEAGSFTMAQLSALKQRSFRDIICDNSQISQVRPLVFRLNSFPQSCSQSQELDLNLFVPASNNNPSGK